MINSPLPSRCVFFYVLWEMFRTKLCIFGLSVWKVNLQNSLKIKINKYIMFNDILIVTKTDKKHATTISKKQIKIKNKIFISNINCILLKVLPKNTSVKIKNCERIFDNKNFDKYTAVIQNCQKSIRRSKQTD